jgi:hypothetical protein
MSTLDRGELTVDLEKTTLNAIDAAVAVTTGRLKLASPQEVRSRLFKGEPSAVAAFRFELARQVAAVLLWTDPYVKAVYEEQEIPPGEELWAEDATLAEPLRLFVEVEILTPALHAVINALNQSLSRAMGGLLPEPPRGYIYATVIDEPNHRLLKPRAYGYRPAPTLLAARDEDGSPDVLHEVSGVPRAIR